MTHSWGPRPGNSHRGELPRRVLELLMGRKLILIPPLTCTYRLEALRLSCRLSSSQKLSPPDLCSKPRTPPSTLGAELPCSSPAPVPPWPAPCISGALLSDQGADPSLTSMVFHPTDQFLESEEAPVVIIRRTKGLHCVTWSNGLPSSSTALGGDATDWVGVALPHEVDGRRRSLFLLYTLSVIGEWSWGSVSRTATSISVMPVFMFFFKNVFK